ncbi:MAG TPA: AIR synthase [Firmicutes bacterium]|nr:AIR synthase [Bacillota bacterium]
MLQERSRGLTARAGKLTPAQLETLVLPYVGARRKEVIRGAGVGVDAALIRFGDSLCVFSVDPITGSSTRSGELCIYVACNDLAAAGAEPVCVGITLVVPVESGEDYIAGFMAEADRACRQMGVAIAAGHTELVAGLPFPLVSVAALGTPWERRSCPGSRLGFAAQQQEQPAEISPGQALVLTKGAGIEGAAVLATDFPDRLAVLTSPEVVDRAQALFRSLSVLPEARIAFQEGATVMHDVTEGGVLGAVWELVHPQGLGVEIWEERIPVLPEVAAICRAVGVDPLKLVSSGSLLVATSRPEELVQALAQQGIRAAAIGHVTEGPRPSDESRSASTAEGTEACAVQEAEGMWLIAADGSRRPIRPPEADELWRARSRLQQPS